MATSKIKPKIRIYEGRSGIEKVYDEIYASPSVCLFGSLKNLSEEFTGRADKLKRNHQIKRHPRARSSLHHDPKDLDFGFAAIGRNYEGRCCTKGVRPLYRRKRVWRPGRNPPIKKELLRLSSKARRSPIRSVRFLSSPENVDAIGAIQKIGERIKGIEALTDLSNRF